MMMMNPSLPPCLPPCLPPNWTIDVRHLHKPPSIQDKYCLYPPNHNRWKCKIEKFLFGTAGPRDFNLDMKQHANKYIWESSQWFSMNVSIFISWKVIDPSLNLDNDTNLCRLSLVPAGLQDCRTVSHNLLQCICSGDIFLYNPTSGKWLFAQKSFLLFISSLSWQEQGDTLWLDGLISQNSLKVGLILAK